MHVGVATILMQRGATWSADTSYVCRKLALKMPAGDKKDGSPPFYFARFFNWNGQSSLRTPITNLDLAARADHPEVLAFVMLQ